MRLFVGRICHGLQIQICSSECRANFRLSRPSETRDVPARSNLSKPRQSLRISPPALDEGA